MAEWTSSASIGNRSGERRASSPGSSDDRVYPPRRRPRGRVRRGRRRAPDRGPRRVRDVTERRDVVALVLALGLVVAVNLITFAVLYDAIASQGPGLSENATQILTGAFGGIVGLLGGYLGYKAGRESRPPGGGDTT